MRKQTTHAQRAVSHIRKRLRQDMERLAVTHRGCETRRGCGCLVDHALTILEAAENGLFKYELDSYMDPKSPRRLVNAANEVEIVTDPTDDDADA